MKISEIKNELARYDTAKGWGRVFWDSAHISELRSFDAKLIGSNEELTPKELHLLALIIFNLKTWTPDTKEGIKTFLAISENLGGHRAIHYLGDRALLTVENVLLLEKYKEYGLNIAKFITLTSFAYTADQMTELLKTINPKSFILTLGYIKELAKDKMLNQASLSLILSTKDYPAKKQILYLMYKHQFYNDDNINKLDGEDSANIVISVNKLNQLMLKPLQFCAVLRAILLESFHCRNLIHGVEKLGVVVNNNELKILLNSPQYATRLAEAIIKLNSIPAINNQIKKFIFSIPEYADELALASCEIVQKMNLNKKGVSLLFTILQEMQAYNLIGKDNPQSILNLKRLNHKELISQSFVSLVTVLGNAQLFNQDNFEKIIASISLAGFIPDLAKGYDHLAKYNILTQENLEHLLAGPVNPISKAHVLVRTHNLIAYIDKLSEDEESEPFSNINLTLSEAETTMDETIEDSRYFIL